MHWLKARSVVLAALIMSLVGFNKASGMMQSEFPFFAAPQWNYDGSRVAIVEGAAILIYDATSEVVLYRLEGHTDTILSLSWSPVDDRLASASADQTVKIWDGDTGVLLHNLTGHNDAVGEVIWSPNGMRLISSGIEGQPSLFVWNPQTGALELSTEAGSIVDAAFSPDGAVLAVSYSLWLVLLDGQSFQPVIEQPYTLCCANQMYSLAWNSEGTQIVTGSINGLITVWDAATLTQLRQFPTNPYYRQDSRDVADVSLSWVRDVAFNADGSIMVVSGDGTVRQWDVNGHLLQEIQLGRLETAAWSAYGTRLAVQGLSSSSTLFPQSGTLTSSDGLLQMVTLFASPARFQSIAELCDAPLTIDRQFDAAADMSNLIAQLEALPAGTIPPACQADLLAVANALQAQPR